MMINTCLIGEADPFIARLLRRFAEESGLKTVRAKVGQDVLEVARQIKPAVIILEAELPGEVRGWEAIHILKADQETCDIPVITCSWLGEAEARELVGHVASHLQKPELHYEDFLAALRAADVEIGRQVGYQEVTRPDEW